MERVAVYTISLGCPKNRVDTEVMLGTLGSAFVPADSADQSDVVLINTCSFIEAAVEESAQVILEAASEIAELDPRPLLVVTGCLPSRYGDELARELPEVDAWIPLEAQSGWAGTVLELLRGTGRGQQIQVGKRDSPSGRGRVLSTGPGMAYLKISEGCNHTCSFCIIPSLRGPLRSRSRDSLVAEARDLVDHGVRELCLVAQDVGAFGTDRGPGSHLQDLLGSLCSLEGLRWLRLMYLYPAGVTPSLLSFLRSLGPPFVPYFDIPLQHAHPGILKRMGRPFAGDPLKVVTRVRETFPEASLRTSLIVGFPGETEEQFQALLDFVRRVRFDHLGVFTFSPEQESRAAHEPGQVSEDVKAKRRDRVLEIQEEISADKLAAYEGRELEVLVERRDPHWPTLYQGRTWFQAPEIDGMTYVSGQALRPGDLVRARLEKASSYDLSGLCLD
jgi:tRNA-2-methylthio-N6-dimethylallyladenosine synthase/ribosomal protein S12 methylthiotransferase